MKIIYDDNGTLAQMVAAPKFLAQLTGTEEEKLIHIANKDLPTGTKYEITDADLSDRSFRNAWEYTAGASEKRGGNKPQAIINFDRYLKNQDKSNSKEGLARERFIEEKLKNYKKLYANGKISKKIFLRKKRQLLEKL